MEFSPKWSRVYNGGWYTTESDLQWSLVYNGIRSKMEHGLERRQNYHEPNLQRVWSAAESSLRR
eukprot:6674625-Lingulodinium_polyedra.AAC.1